jgi:hypothetical protein
LKINHLATLLATRKGTGLPNDIFAYQKYQFWYTLSDLGMEQFSIYYGHLVFSWTFGKFLWLFCGHLVCFSVFGILYQAKSGNPDCGTISTEHKIAKCPPPFEEPFKWTEFNALSERAIFFTVLEVHYVATCWITF